jgi:hypothetical protein
VKCLARASFPREAELEPEIPPDAEDDDLQVEMAALEKIIRGG